MDFYDDYLSYCQSEIPRSFRLLGNTLSKVPLGVLFYSFYLYSYVTLASETATTFTISYVLLVSTKITMP